MARAIEAAVMAERAAQEERNRQALELLHSKDAALKAALVKVRIDRIAGSWLGKGSVQALVKVVDWDS